MESGYGYSPYQYAGQYAAEQSTLEKITAKVYQAKFKVSKTLKKPEDEHLVASDAELDAKLETYKHVQHSCTDLQRIVSMYATQVYALAQAENELGRFLKQQGERDKTRAGKMMQATGKSLSCASQQRLSLRVPLTRLGSEVEVFSNRAVIDCDVKVKEMEDARTNYRSHLLWMKDVSERLDPEAFNRLEKFRKVQTQVKRAKDQFDKLKLDSMQKVDLLIASRCNMFSRVLVLYQQTIVQFSHKTARIMCAVADAFQGYQYFEFNMLRELTDCTRKLARETSGRADSSDDEAEDFDSGEQTLREVESKLNAIVSDNNVAAQEVTDSDSLQLPTLAGAFSFGTKERDRDSNALQRDLSKKSTTKSLSRNSGGNSARTADRIMMDDDLEDPTKLYEYIRRSVFQPSKADTNAKANSPTGASKPKAAAESTSKAKAKAKPKRTSNPHGNALRKATNTDAQSILDTEELTTNEDTLRQRRSGPIRDDAEDLDLETPSSARGRGGPNPDIALEKLDELFAKEYSEDADPFAEPIDLSSGPSSKATADSRKAPKDTAAVASQLSNVESLLDGLDLNTNQTDADRALLSDLFGGDGEALGSYAAPLQTTEFANMFDVSPKSVTAAAASTDSSVLLGDDDPWKAFAAAMPSRQIESVLQGSLVPSGQQQHSANAPSYSSQQQHSLMPMQMASFGLTTSPQSPQTAAEVSSPRNPNDLALLDNLNRFAAKPISGQQQAGPSLASLSAMQRPVGGASSSGTVGVGVGGTVAAAGMKPVTSGGAPILKKEKDAQLSDVKREELAAWFNMFADLDPLANPDKVGRKQGQDDGFNEA